MGDHINQLNQEFSEDEYNPHRKLLRIANELGVRVDVWPFGDSAPSWIWNTGNGWVVALNSDDPPEIRTVNLAHELIHYLNHRTLTPCNIFSSDGACCTNPILEEQANYLGRRLLLPESLMYKIWPCFDPQHIARELGVPANIVTQRIVDVWGFQYARQYRKAVGFLDY